MCSNIIMVNIMKLKNRSSSQACEPVMFTQLHCERNTLHGFKTSAYSVA